MKGTVLGFDGTTGAISGEDGQRYSFSAADWRGAKPAAVNDRIDFVAGDGVASEVYPVQGSVLSGFGGGPGAGAGGGGVAFVAERPQLVLAALALVAALLIPMVSYGRLSVTALGFPGMLSELNRFSGGLGLLHLLTYLLWVIPAGAGFVLFADLTGSRRTVAELVTGIACVAALPIFLIVEAAMPGGVAGLMGFAFGGILLVAVGVGLILTGTGRLQRIPGL